MPKKDKQSFVKLLLEIPGGPVLYDGRELCLRDKIVSRDAIRLYCAVVRSCVGIENNANDGRIVELLKSCYTTDLFALLDGLGKLDAWLLRSVEHKETRGDTAFKQQIQTCPRALEPLRIVKSLTATQRKKWRDHSDPTAFAKCHQCFAFLSRLNLRDESLTEVAYTKWCDSEQSVRMAGKPTALEKEICEEWFPLINAGLLYSLMSPGHGSGSTAERISNPAEKFLVLGRSKELDEFARITGWYDILQDNEMLQSPCIRVNQTQKGWDEVPSRCLILQSPKDSYFVRIVDSPFHRVIFVPKNWKTYRTVSMEPVTVMWWQQAAGTAIKRYLRGGYSKMSRYYNTDTEYQNREAALRGSIDGSVATIDWSSASDLVAYGYMSDLADGTALSPFIEYLRTSYALLPERTYQGKSLQAGLQHVDKLMPMGAALCFPLEVLAFAVPLEATFRKESWKYQRTDLKRMRACLHVYGDDTTLPVELVEPYLERMHEIGHQVNLDKSFYNAGIDQDFFRESCGGEYLNGTDVTPVRISRKFRGFVFYPEYSDLECRTETDVANLMQLANDLYDLDTARWMVVNHLLSVGEVPVLFDETGERGIKSSSPTNFHLKERWNSELQEWEVFACTLRKVSKGYYQLCKEKDVELSEDGRWVYTADLMNLPGEIRLFEYLRQSELSSREQLLYPEDSLQLQLDPHSFTMVACVSWVISPLQKDALIGGRVEPPRHPGERDEGN